MTVMNTLFCFRLKLFQRFDSFRILICGGDGSIGWVLSEIDKLDLHKQVGAVLWGESDDGKDDEEERVQAGQGKLEMSWNFK